MLPLPVVVETVKVVLVDCAEPGCGSIESARISAAVAMKPINSG